jgi:hypothetical protein
VKVSGTKRTPIGRPPRPIISELHRELGLKPWHEDVFDVDIDTPVPERLQTQLDVDQFCYVRDLRRQLVAMT